MPTVPGISNGTSIALIRKIDRPIGANSKRVILSARKLKSSREITMAPADRDTIAIADDLGMPRDVDPTSADIDGVNLISMIELQAKSTESWELRAEAAAEAQGLIDDGVRRFKERLTGIDHEPVIRMLGARMEQMRREEVEQTLGRLDGLTEKQATSVEKLTRSLVRRILADPISFLRSEEDSAAEAVQKVFALVEEDEELE